MSQLITVASAKTHLGIDNTTFDTVLDALVTRVSGLIERYCDRTFASTAYTEDYDGDGSDAILVRQVPIISVSSVHDDQDRDFTDATLIAAADYYVDKPKGMVKLIGGRFGVGVGNVRVAYTAGFAATPDLVALACAELVSFYFNRRQSGGRSSESMGGLSVSHLTEWPADVKEMLQQYVSRVATW